MSSYRVGTKIMRRNQTAASDAGRITIPEANLAPENGWLEDDRFLLGFVLFSGVMLVSGRVTYKEITRNKLKDIELTGSANSAIRHGCQSTTSRLKNDPFKSH